MLGYQGFIGTLFTVSERWKQCKDPSVDEERANVVDIYNEILFSLKRTGKSDNCYIVDKP